MTPKRHLNYTTNAEVAIKEVFNYLDYREYLIDQLGEQGTRTGLRKKACRHLNCHSTYLSQVLSEKIHLSLEHAEALNDFFQHTKEQSEFFILLVLRGRAGSQKLKTRFEAQIKEVLKKRSLIKNRLKDSVELSLEDQDKFYSHWVYTALHVLVSIKGLQTAEALSQATGIHIKKISEELEFLQKTGLIVGSNGHYSIGPKMVHLSADSNAVIKHHTNWRFHAIQNANQRDHNNLHYSAVVALSQEAVDEIKESLLKNLEKHIKTIEKAPEEMAYIYNFDFYKLAQGNTK